MPTVAYLPEAEQERAALAVRRALLRLGDMEAG